MIPYLQNDLWRFDFGLEGVFGTGVFINTFVASLVLLFAGPEG